VKLSVNGVNVCEVVFVAETDVLSTLLSEHILHDVELSAFCATYVAQKISKANHYCDILWHLSSDCCFVYFPVKLIYFDGRSKYLVIILNFQILHGSVAMQLRQDGRLSQA